MALLTKTILNSITNTLYTGATVGFYSVTPTGGETLITTLTDGFPFVGERRAGPDRDGRGVKLWLAGDASITLAQLKVGGVAVITANGVTTRYGISELLPQEQIGAGYFLRLLPQKGAAG